MVVDGQTMCETIKLPLQFCQFDDTINKIPGLNHVTMLFTVDAEQCTKSAALALILVFCFRMKIALFSLLIILLPPDTVDEEVQNCFIANHMHLSGC